MNDRDLTCFEYMLNFAKRVERRISGVSLERFLDDMDIQDSVLYAVGHIGEYANSISEETRAKHHDILWSSLIGLRNRVFHSYGVIDMQIIYEVAVEHTPKLIEQLQKVLEEN